MKKLFIALALLVSTSAFADTHIVATDLPAGKDIDVDAFIAFKASTGEAWIQTSVTEWGSEDYQSYDSAKYPVAGLSYNSGTKEVLYKTAAGDVVVCGKRSIFSLHHLKLSGRCVVATTTDGQTTAVSFEAK